MQGAFLNEPKVINADCLEALRAMEDNSVDAVVTDPPYGLSNTKPAQVAEILRRWVAGDVEHVPEKRGGFMGQDWDSFVPPPAVWVECMRVLKPGGHMVVFAGSRTQDLMGLSIRLAGFEIRDTLGWIYGSGFPKSMDISKAIDKGSGENRRRQLQFTEWMRSTGITAKQINEVTGTDMGGHYLTSNSQPAIATIDLFDKLRPLLPEVPEHIERLVAERTGVEWTDYVKREVVGVRKTGLGTGKGGTAIIGDSDNKDITAAFTDAAKQWDGWGTALKPAIEPIILARKPLVGTVAQNVLEHGTGGLNIDGCRVGDSGGGRFPANALLDEHAAEELDKQSGHSVSTSGRTAGTPFAVIGNRGKAAGALRGGHDDSGGASRFFPMFKYQAKAPKKERPVIVRDDGTKIQHPTVKPAALMEWLVTLITPPGGTILDPFAGTGTTLQAARNKGFDSIGIEAEEDYIHLINQRLA